MLENFKNLSFQKQEKTTFKPRIERQGHVTRIFTEKVSYVLIYGIHTITEKADSLPDNTSMLFLEDAGDWIMEKNAYECYGRNIQYERLTVKAKSKNIPICMADFSLNEKFFKVEDSVFYGEFGLGGMLVVGGLLKAEKDKIEIGKSITSRRDFLKKVGAVAVGLHFLTPLVSEEINDINLYNSEDISKSQQVFRTIKNTHPEIYPLTLSLRNTVIATKEQWLAEQIENKPIITIVIGGSHAGIEKDLQSSFKEKLEYLERFKPVLRMLTDIPESFYSIRVNFPDGRVETLVVNELKKIFEEAAAIAK